jgi:DNA mismatch endonuclease (patch repair protein)
MDVMTPEQRSRNMAAIRSRGNRTTEKALRFRLVQSGIGDWKLHGDLPGRPDFVFGGHRLLVFVDGCYWHGCPRCYRPPQSHPDFWAEKVEYNRTRDKKTRSALRRRGWKVIRIWEHEIKEAPTLVIERIREALAED